MSSDLEKKVDDAITSSRNDAGRKVAVVVSADDLQYAVRLIQARCTGGFGTLFWGGKTGSSWTVTVDTCEPR